VVAVAGIVVVAVELNTVVVVEVELSTAVVVVEA
jgi:hypothetical protein